MKKAPVKKRTLPTRQAIQSIKKRTVQISSKTLRFVDKRPLFSFFAVLGIVVILIVLGNFFFTPKPTIIEEKKVTKSVSVYRIGESPKITVAAQTKKSGVIEIVALSGGVIDTLHVQEGAQVDQGMTLVSMSSNYKGENTFALQRQISSAQYQGALSMYPKQKETIERQKELAEKTEENSEELRKITTASIEETKILVKQNEDILTTLSQQLQASPSDLALKQQVAQYQASTNQARQALRSSEYDAGSDNPPADIADLNKEISKRQFDVQLKQLQINLEVSRLQAAVAQINESLMFPSAPFAGTVQRVFVKEKQQVSPGTPLMIISQTENTKPITAVAYVSADVAKKVSRIEPSVLHIGDKSTYTSIPTFVSTEAVQGTLYAVYYPIPQEQSSAVTSEGYISVDIPVGYADTTMIATYIPLDAVYQTRDSAYVFVTRENVAQSKEVQLGHVFGRFVEVTEGLKNGDTIILNRNIIAGDIVRVR